MDSSRPPYFLRPAIRASIFPFDTIERVKPIDKYKGWVRVAVITFYDAPQGKYGFPDPVHDGPGDTVHYGFRKGENVLWFRRKARLDSPGGICRR